VLAAEVVLRYCNVVKGFFRPGSVAYGSSCDRRTCTMPTSLRDVAARAGVSVKTVSNVVNGYLHVSTATRARVHEALDELNYRPNLSARNLRNRRSGIVALALPELDLPYFAELTRCVIKAAEAKSWTVLIDQTDGLPDRESVVLQGIRDQLIDGLI